MTEFLKNNSDPEQWQKTVQYFKELLAVPDTESCKKVAELLDNYSRGWDEKRYVYTLAHMDVAALIALAEVKNNLWNHVFNAKACFGPVEDLRFIYDTMREKKVSVNLNAALLWASTVTEFCPKLKSEGNFETTEQLFQWGANPAYTTNSSSHSSYHFYRAVNECGVDMGRLYALAGLPADTLRNQMTNVQSNDNKELYRKFRTLYWEYGRFIVPDGETLVEKKDFDPSNNQRRLTIIFNFSSNRVHEILDISDNKAHTQIKEYDFENYNPVAIERAREKLIELGGTPPDGNGTARIRSKARPMRQSAG